MDNLYLIKIILGAEKKKDHAPILFYKASITLISKPDMDIGEEKIIGTTN